MIFRPMLWPTVMTTVFLMILCTLGYWQIQRMTWKTNVLDRLQAGIQAGPGEISGPDLIRMANENDCDTVKFQQIAVLGHFLPGFARVSETRKGGLYDRLFRPFLVDEGPLVLVDWGSVGRDGGMPKRLHDAGARLPVSIRCPNIGGMFTPKPDREAGRWFATDIGEIAGWMTIDSPFETRLYLQVLPRPGFPLARRDPGELRASIPNNHLSYAVTWFSFAMILLIIYIIFHVRAGRLGPKK